MKLSKKIAYNSIINMIKQNADEEKIKQNLVSRKNKTEK